MWLLNATTRCLEYFPDQTRTQYAILSHTWGDQEVTFQEMRTTGPSRQIVNQKRGYQKIEYTCVQALEDDLQYAWIDTCCIDKSSSAELSEAINSMFNWYKDAKVCYAYLTDVHSGDCQDESLRISRWFTRGWTLQELLAPSELVFYTSDWRMLATKAGLALLLESITGIKEVYLQVPYRMHRTSVARRMSWAARRETTRIEDRAYSLLGIFDVNIALLYGEGQKAFRRLQEEIIRRSMDQSILAWSIGANGVLADSPDSFAGSGRVIGYAGYDLSFSERMECSSAGVLLTAPVMPVEGLARSRSSQDYILILNSTHEDDPRGLLGLKVRPAASEQNAFSALQELLTITSRSLVGIPLEDIQKVETRRVVLTPEASWTRHSLTGFSHGELRRSFWFRPHGNFAEAFTIVKTFPEENWRSAASMLHWPPTSTTTLTRWGCVTWWSANSSVLMTIVVKLLPLDADLTRRLVSQEALYRVFHSTMPMDQIDIETHVGAHDYVPWQEFVFKPYKEQHDWARSQKLLMSQEASVDTEHDGKIVVYGECQFRLGQWVYVLDIDILETEAVETS